jgi:elongation factor Ts
LKSLKKKLKKQLLPKRKKKLNYKEIFEVIKMSEVSATLVKKLRDTTGAGMMDCKKALAETNGNLEEAIDWLRKKGHAAASKKSGRVAAEGLVAVATNSTRTVGVIIELNSETDFVARNDKFQKLVGDISKLAVNVDSLEQLKAAKLENGRTVQDEVTENIAVIGENLNLRRMAKISVEKGIVATYVHNTVATDMGKIAVLIGLQSDIDASALQTLGKQLAMHIAAAKPIALTSAQVDSKAVQREKDIFSEQAKSSGKPQEIIEKMIEGRIKKFYQEVVLLEQVFVIDGKTKIQDVIDKFAQDNKGTINVVDFVCFELGQGVEQEEKDFASEVAAVIGNK